MNVNFFVTCIGDALKSRMARDSVLLLEKLGCRVNFPEKQGCCGQPAINSGYIKEAIPGMKNLIAALEDNDDVQNVYANFEMDDATLESLNA